MKKVQEEKEKQDEMARKTAIGERFDKEKLKQVKSPSFLTRKEE